MMWPCGHQCSQNGWSASETSTVRKPCADSAGVDPAMCTCSSLSRSRSKAIDPSEPLISHLKAFLRPVAKRVASIVPTAPPRRLTTDSNASSTSRPGLKVAVVAATDSISPTR